MRFLISYLLFLTWGQAASAAVVVDFEDWTGGEGEQHAAVSGGYVLGGLFSIGPDPASGNSTNALHSLQYTFKVFPAGGSTFAVTSLDLQEGLAPSVAATVTLIGYLQGANQVVQTFHLDGLLDTYQTFYPAGFSSLEGLFFYAHNGQGSPAGGFSVDNIVVPEPTLPCLIGLAVLALRRPR